MMQAKMKMYATASIADNAPTLACFFQCTGFGIKKPGRMGKTLSYRAKNQR
jgi:hypothetical protein